MRHPFRKNVASKKLLDFFVNHNSDHLLSLNMRLILPQPACSMQNQRFVEFCHGSFSGFNSRSEYLRMDWYYDECHDSGIPHNKNGPALFQVNSMHRWLRFFPAKSVTFIYRHWLSAVVGVFRSRPRLSTAPRIFRLSSSRLARPDLFQLPIQVQAECVQHNNNN